MRRHGVLAFLVLFCVTSFAQLPTRAQLTAKPKFTEDVPHTFKDFTEAELREAIKIVPARSYAMFGYNTPEVRLQLPKVSNSVYTTIDFPDPVVLDDAGKPVAVEIERGGYNDARFSDEIRFRVPDNSDAIVQFAHATGTVKVKYPLSVTTQTFAPLKPGPKEFAVKINGPFVNLDQEKLQVPDVSSKLHPIRAYDASGHQLESASYSETGYDDAGAYVTKMAFYGNVAKLEVDSVAEWVELELPYDVKPGPMLPAGHEGEDPANYTP
ncbi:MAG: hypothetical protein HYX28_03250 [Candidatus Koribacter versatilis]|uniref:Uncharacterized protein n=1 Tax=Candidatus Korobacter versatilis TaxID=658062 RepID=A0A932A7W1_9BACT|nr:hypothetical protein [Candidatus Koribacter versatilis]